MPKIILLLFLLISGCGAVPNSLKSSQSSSLVPAAAEGNGRTVKSFGSVSELPICDNLLQENIAYVRGNQTFFICSAGAWKRATSDSEGTIGPQGPTGTQGAQGPIGPQGSPGTISAVFVYDTAGQKLGRYLGNRDNEYTAGIEFSNGAYGYFDIDTGSTMTENCFFASSDCSGTCMLDRFAGQNKSNTTASRLPVGRIYRSGMATFVITTGAEVASVRSAGSYIDTTGQCATTTLNAPLFLVNTVYQLPAGVTYPFSLPIIMP